MHEGYDGQVWRGGNGKRLEAGAAGGHWEAKRINSFDHIGKTTGECYVVDSYSRTIFEGYRAISLRGFNDVAWRQVA